MRSAVRAIRRFYREFRGQLDNPFSNDRGATMKAVCSDVATKFLSVTLLSAAILILVLATVPASAQDNSIYIQCGGAGTQCVNLAAGDGKVTMASDDAKELYIFSFNEVPLPGEAGAPSDPDFYAGWIMNEGALGANAPAPTIVADEDIPVFLNLTNVGMVLRPDLSDPHTVHWHGFPNASAVFDGVPDSSISISMGATLTYYYEPVDAGTYMYHCHVEATEHMQMGMLGNLYVRPRQNRCDTIADDPDLPGSACPAGHVNGTSEYAYNDGDGSTRYDVEAAIQIGSFDPDFHDASYLVQPLPFAGMRDKYFLLNGRGYPDTLDPMVRTTWNEYQERLEESQPVTSLVTANQGDVILLRISNLNVTQFNTLGTNGLPMKVIALDARLLRDDDGGNMYYNTTSLTLGGGMSADVLIDTRGADGVIGGGDDISAGRYFLFSKNLDRLVNNAENFGGAMTEIVIN